MKTPETKTDRRASALALLDTGIGLILSGILIILRVCEVNNIFYRIVVALCAIWCILNWFYILAVAAGAAKSAYRRFKRDRRIIRQAKAAGVWDKKPIVLGGRALELKAWKDCKIKRVPGETDIDLRVRYMMKMIEKGFIAKGPKKTKKAKKDLIQKVKRIAAEHGYKDAKVKTDGYNVEVTLCDDTVPKDIEVTVHTETGGQENDVDN